MDFSGVSLTAKEFAEAADINNIIKAYRKAGIQIGGPNDPMLNRKYLGQYGVEVDPLDYSESMQRKSEVESRFNELPAAEKAEHKNAAAWFKAQLTPKEPEPQTPAASPPEPQTISKTDDPIKGEVL